MFLTPPNTKRPFYYVIYFVDGKRTKISTKTSDRKEAEKFLASFVPQPREKKALLVKKGSIKLSSFFNEYKTYIANTYSERYLKKLSFLPLQACKAKFRIYLLKIFQLKSLISISHQFFQNPNMQHLFTIVP